MLAVSACLHLRQHHCCLFLTNLSSFSCGLLLVVTACTLVKMLGHRKSLRRCFSQVEADLAAVTAELVNATAPDDEVSTLRQSLSAVQKSLAAAQQKVRLRYLL